MTHEEMEKEVLEISAFLKILSHLDNCDIDILDLQTVASVFVMIYHEKRKPRNRLVFVHMCMICIKMSEIAAKNFIK